MKRFNIHIQTNSGCRQYSWCQTTAICQGGGLMEVSSYLRICWKGFKSMCACLRTGAWDGGQAKVHCGIDVHTHLFLNYSSCQLPCPASPWKPLTESFIPSQRIHLFILSSALTSFSTSLSLIISSLICSFSLSSHLKSFWVLQSFHLSFIYSLYSVYLSSSLVLNSHWFTQLILFIFPFFIVCWHSLLC